MNRSKDSLQCSSESLVHSPLSIVVRFMAKIRNRQLSHRLHATAVNINIGIDGTCEIHCQMIALGSMAVWSLQSMVKVGVGMRIMGVRRRYKDIYGLQQVALVVGL